MNQHHRPATDFHVARFGRRKVVPRVCIIDGKPHIRRFLGDALEELGFLTGECMAVDQLGSVLREQAPDLVVMGLSAGGTEVARTLEAFAAEGFDGKILLLGPRESLMLKAVQQLGEELQLGMLPMLATPFDSSALRGAVAPFMPIEAPPSPVIDASEALRAGWLEIWYQPKFSIHTLQISGAEALVRVRHPNWGVVPPAYFLPSADDPQLRRLSDFVISRAIGDCSNIIGPQASIEMAVNLPIGFFRDPQAILNLCQQMANLPVVSGFIVEVDAADVIRNLDLMKAAARQLRFGNIALALDNLGTEWPALVGVTDMPFVQIKVDRSLISGCADDRLKQAVCRQILDLADGFGARTVAEGVETRADFHAVRELGFDLAQGFLLAKPMTAQKFAMTVARLPDLAQ